MVWSASFGDGITAGWSGCAGAIEGGSGSGAIGGPPDDTLARLVTAPLMVMGAQCSNCAGLSV